MCTLTTVGLTAICSLFCILFVGPMFSFFLSLSHVLWLMTMRTDLSPAITHNPCDIFCTTATAQLLFVTRVAYIPKHICAALEVSNDFYPFRRLDECQ